MSLARLVLRAVAIAIAVGGLIDPAWTVSRPPPRKLVMIRALATAQPEVEAALRAALRGWDIEPREAAPRLRCGAEERCVVIADGSTDASVPDDLTNPVALITVRSDADPDVSVRSVSVSRGHQYAAGVARVELSRTPSVTRSEIRVLDAAAVIGRATHQWSGASATATVDVPWWPIETGARMLRIEVLPVGDERTTIDNHIDAGVDVAVTRASVLVFDPRPSWSSTFVRRALADDARFTVGYRTRLAPALSAGTANGRLDTAALDLAATVVVGAPDGLTSDDVTLLERFVQVRGGSLILLPDRSPSGPWSRLLPGTWTEHLATTPEGTGPLRATEFLRAERLPITARVVARSGSAASIVVIPSGHGHIVVSGAMDAWRYRDAKDSFDGFWRSLIADTAAWGEGLQLTFDQSLAGRGDRSRFTVHDRRMAASGSSEASAVARCGSGPATTIRLWPAGPAGAFTGELPLTHRGSCSIEATVNDRQTAGSIAVADQPRRGLEHTLTTLERRVDLSGGVVAHAGGEANVARALSASSLPPVAATVSHPMRAWWWMLPFAACLSLEWWLRRRAGLR